MDRDSIDPSFQTGSPVKMLHPTKDLDENILSSVGCVCRVGEDSVDYPINRLMNLPNQPRICIFRARLQFGDDGCFFCSNSDRACEVAHVGCSRHHSHGVTSIIGPATQPCLLLSLDPTEARNVPGCVTS